MEPKITRFSLPHAIQIEMRVKSILLARVSLKGLQKHNKLIIYGGCPICFDSAGALPVALSCK